MLRPAQIYAWDYSKSCGCVIKFHIFLSIFGLIPSLVSPLTFHMWFILTEMLFGFMLLVTDESGMKKKKPAKNLKKPNPKTNQKTPANQQQP